jgi:hypothetical protein
MAMNLFSSPFQNNDFSGYFSSFGGGYSPDMGGYSMPFRGYSPDMGGYSMPFRGYSPYGMQQMPFNPFGSFGGFGGGGQFDFASYFDNLMSQYFGKQKEAPTQESPTQEAPTQQETPSTGTGTGTAPAPMFNDKFGMSALKTGQFGRGGVQQLKQAGIVQNKQQANQMLSDFQTANAGKDVTQAQFQDYAKAYKAPIPAAPTFTMPAPKVVANNVSNIKTVRRGM